MDFSNKVVIVTGASDGIGRATALEFAKNNAKVCAVDINTEKLKSLTSDKNNGDIKAFECDISDEASVKDTTSKILDEYGKIDVLVNNAGIWRFWGEFIATNSDEWKKIFDVNVFGTMYFTQAVLGNMIENKYGRIINVGSVAGVYGNANMVAYSASKGAVSSFTKAIAKEVAHHNITVNNVVPGNVKAEASEHQPALSFMNRSGYPDEFAHFICFLASENASYISGQDHQIDGCRKRL